VPHPIDLLFPDGNNDWSRVSLLFVFAFLLLALLVVFTHSIQILVFGMFVTAVGGTLLAWLLSIAVHTHHHTR
jgi:Flp pilus assembly protein TadB